MVHHSAQTYQADAGAAGNDPGGQKVRLKAKAVTEGKKILAVTLYLWVFFAVLDLHKTAILQQHHIDYEVQGFAIVNALVFGKVMLVADQLKLGARFRDRPLIYGVLYASLLFAIVLIGFHIAEGAVLALLHHKPLSQSLAGLGAGNVRGVLTYGAIAFVALIPFFLFRGIARAIGEDQVWGLVFVQDQKPGMTVTQG